MKILDNINHTVREDLQDTMQKGSRVSIAAACFSIYAYQELKKQLEEIAELRFIFTSPTFVQENTPKERREFYIPKLTREKSLYGTEFEVRLRNELTQKALAKECADWVRRKVKFRSNVSGEQMPGFMTVGESSYMPISRFTTVDLGCERGNNAYYPVQRTEAFENGRYFLSLFDEIWNDSSRLQDVTDIVLQSISTAYRENSPDFIYFFTLYNIFSEFLEDVSEDNLPNEATGFKQSKIWNMLYDFQRDAALAIIHKLEQYNGCILADSVGLGKTFTALAVIKYYENRNKSVLVLCPKKLAANWNIYKGNYVNNPLVEDRFRYDVLYHTDLSRSGGTSNGIDLAALNWGNFDLVVIDESHNFRNGSNTSTDEKENRYTKLMNRVIRSGVRTKVLMLSATPVNNRFVDLKNQLALAYEGDAGKINEKLNTSSPIDEIFRQAQKAFNTWSKLPVTERTTNAVMDLNAIDSGHRKFIMVQLPEQCDKKSEAYKNGYKNVSDIGKERIRRAGDKLYETLKTSGKDYQHIAKNINTAPRKTFASDDGQTSFEVPMIPARWSKTDETAENQKLADSLDIGFRVFKLDDTNMKDVYYSADEYSQTNLEDLESNIKEDRTDLDLLFGCLLDWGLPLSMPYRSEKIDNCTVHTYAPGDAALNVPDALIACFDSNVPENVIKEIAKRKPRRAVFRDSSFASSPEKINVFEIFKLYAPDTDVKVI